MKQYKRILRDLFNQCDKTTIDSGMVWYKTANKIVRHISTTHNIDVNIVAEVMSALSPAVKWEQNIKDTFNVIKYGNEAKVVTYSSNKNKAIKIMNKETSLVFKGAPKTFSFAKNIMLNEDHVTIDRWILRAFDLEVKQITPVQYIAMQNSFIKVAKELQIKPYQLQAIIWIHVRNNIK